MTGVRILKLGEDLPAAALSALKAQGAAAWLIDVTGGCILAANAAGGALLGIGPAGATPMLDAAMPALARLRTLVSVPRENAETSERLVFWTRNGVMSVRSRVRILDAETHALALVTVCEGPDADTTHPAGPSALFADDDAAKLKEIARRIREGQMTRPRHEPRRHSDAGQVPLSPREAPSPDSGSEPTLPFSLRASLAHELKTPVSAIAAAAEIMKDQRFGPLGAARYVGYATDIHGSALHMLGVIDRMLAEDAADPEAAQRALAFAEIDAGEMLQASVSQLAPLAEQAGIGLVLDLAPRLPHVVADATSLRQMVFNLVTNALKFTERGGQVTVAARYAGDGPLTIAVSDTGAGMARSEVERLLVPGRGRRAARRSSTAGAKGLGLGLPLVQALAAANGAELVIESAPGQGTSASIVFKKDRVIPV